MWTPVGRTAKTTLEAAHGREIKFSQQLWWTFLHLACQLHIPSAWDICGIVLCDKTAHFKVVYIGTHH
jgi:hypothetical protein